MKNMYPRPILAGASIKANASTGYIAETLDGKPAKLAIIDDDGNVLASGQDVAWAAWSICVEALENLWTCQGWLVVHSSPPGDPALHARASSESKKRKN